jgi:hypothetical protein
LVSVFRADSQAGRSGEPRRGRSRDCRSRRSRRYRPRMDYGVRGSVHHQLANLSTRLPLGLNNPSLLAGSRLDAKGGSRSPVVDARRLHGLCRSDCFSKALLSGLNKSAVRRDSIGLLGPHYVSPARHNVPLAVGRPSLVGSPLCTQIRGPLPKPIDKSVSEQLVRWRQAARVRAPFLRLLVCPRRGACLTGLHLQAHITPFRGRPGDFGGAWNSGNKIR